MTINESVIEGEESAAVYKAATPGQEGANNVPYKDEDIIVNDDIKSMIEMVSKRIMCVKESIYRFGTDWQTIKLFLETFEEEGINKLVNHCLWLNERQGKPLRSIVEEVNADDLMEASKDSNEISEE